jgi:hypothetical protein
MHVNASIDGSGIAQFDYQFGIVCVLSASMRDEALVR